MKSHKNIVAGTLALASLAGFLFVLYFLMTKEIPKANADYFKQALIAIIGFVGTGLGYYLGSTAGSARKNEILFANKEKGGTDEKA